MAYYTLSCDAIRLSETQRRKAGIDVAYEAFPAVKLARFAVDNNYKNKGVGTFLLKRIVGEVLSLNDKVACRFITTDALVESVGFYRSFGFRKGRVSTKRPGTIKMRFDLLNEPRPHQLRLSFGS